MAKKTKEEQIEAVRAWITDHGTAGTAGLKRTLARYDRIVREVAVLKEKLQEKTDSRKREYKTLSAAFKAAKRDQKKRRVSAAGKAPKPRAKGSLPRRPGTDGSEASATS